MTSLEAEPVPPAEAGAARAADAVSYAGGTLVLLGLLALAFT